MGAGPGRKVLADNCGQRIRRCPSLRYLYACTTEVQSHLYVAFDQGYLDLQAFKSLYNLTLQVKKLISGFMRYLRSQPRTSNVEP